MHRFLLYNGEIRDTAEHFLSPGQVGYLYGWGVFSTLRVYDGVPFEWERHWPRMKEDAVRLHVPFPQDAEALARDLSRLVEANQAWNAAMRVTVIRNRGGLWEGPAATRDFDVLGFTGDLFPWGDSLKLTVVPNGRNAANEFAGSKINSWAENLVRYERAHQEGFDEALLLNERSEVCECTSANIFAVYANRVLTPPLSSGCLPGVTRSLLLDQIRVPGLEVKESVLRLEDLEAADEIFLTSTTRELLPVASIQGLKIRTGRAARELLQSAFTTYVKSYVAERRRSVAILP